MPDTVSSLEIIRFVISCAGALVCWLRGRATTQERLPILRAVPMNETRHSRIDRTQRIERLELVNNIQIILFLLHAGFAVNAAINAFYPSSGYEQLNVISSNTLQVLAPIALIVISEMLTAHVQKATAIQELVSETGGISRLRRSHLYSGVLVPVDDDDDDPEPESKEPQREDSPSP